MFIWAAHMSQRILKKAAVKADRDRPQFGNRQQSYGIGEEWCIDVMVAYTNRQHLQHYSIGCD